MGFGATHHQQQHDLCWFLSEDSERRVQLAARRPSSSFGGSCNTTRTSGNLTINRHGRVGMQGHHDNLAGAWSIHPTISKDRTMGDHAAQAVLLGDCYQRARPKSHTSLGSVRPVEPLQKTTGSNPWATVIPPRPQHATALDDITLHESRFPMAKGKGYKRPSRPRIKCELCNIRPGGFRDKPELQRHFFTQHRRTDTDKWVCCDPTTLGYLPKLMPTKPLSECKLCSHPRKYSAYYNAAAHLRRVHFRRLRDQGVRPMHRGAWPSMKDLKPWIRSITVENDASLSDGETSQENALSLRQRNMKRDSSLSAGGGPIKPYPDSNDHIQYNIRQPQVEGFSYPMPLYVN